MTDVPTTALTINDLAPTPTPLTTGASPVTIPIGPRLYEITTGGTAGVETIIIPMPDLPVDGWANNRLIGLRITFSLITRTNAADVVSFTLTGSSTIYLAGTEQFFTSSLTTVTLSYAGAAISFVWCNDQWMVDAGYTDGDFDFHPTVGSPVGFGGGWDELGGGVSASFQGGNAKAASNKDGGDIVMIPGSKDGSGRNGLVICTVFPTADPHVVGGIWNNAGVLTVSAG